MSVRVYYIHSSMWLAFGDSGVSASSSPDWSVTDNLLTVLFGMQVLGCLDAPFCVVASLSDLWSLKYA